jgi:hypothetical protein
MSPAELAADVLRDRTELEATDEAGDGDTDQTSVRSSRRRRGGRGRGRSTHGLPAEVDDTIVSETIAGVEVEPTPVGIGGHAAEDGVSDAEDATDQTVAEMEASSPTAAAQADEHEDVPYPRTGVEIVDSVEREGVVYHAMRDLRNLKVVHNVTRDSARRLWRYAITQRETHELQPEEVTWSVNGRGFWKAYKQRGGEQRFNLAYRHDAHVHVFYGVTDEGLDDEWRAIVPADKLPQAAGDEQEQIQPEDGEFAVNATPPVAPVAVDVSDHPVATIADATPTVPHDSVAPVVVETTAPAPEPVAEVAPAPGGDESPWLAAVRAALEAAAGGATPAAPDPVVEVATPVVEPEPTADPAPKPVRRRAPRKKVEPTPALEAEADVTPTPAQPSDLPAAAGAEPVVTPELEAEAEPAPAPKPVRRRAPRKKAEPVVPVESELAATQPEPVAEPPVVVKPTAEPDVVDEPAPPAKPVRRRAPRKKAEPAPEAPSGETQGEG